MQSAHVTVYTCKQPEEREKIQGIYLSVGQDGAPTFGFVQQMKLERISASQYENLLKEARIVKVGEKKPNDTESQEKQPQGSPAKETKPKDTPVEDKQPQTIPAQQDPASVTQEPQLVPAKEEAQPQNPEAGSLSSSQERIETEKLEFQEKQSKYFESKKDSFQSSSAEDKEIFVQMRDMIQKEDLNEGKVETKIERDQANAKEYQLYLKLKREREEEKRRAEEKRKEEDMRLIQENPKIVHLSEEKKMIPEKKTKHSHDSVNKNVSRLNKMNRLKREQEKKVEHREVNMKKLQEEDAAKQERLNELRLQEQKEKAEARAELERKEALRVANLTPEQREQERLKKEREDRLLRAFAEGKKKEPLKQQRAKDAPIKEAPVKPTLVITSPRAHESRVIPILPTETLPKRPATSSLPHAVVNTNTVKASPVDKEVKPQSLPQPTIPIVPVITSPSVPSGLSSSSPFPRTSTNTSPLTTSTNTSPLTTPTNTSPLNSPSSSVITSPTIVVNTMDQTVINSPVPPRSVIASIPPGLSVQSDSSSEEKEEAAPSFLGVPIVPLPTTLPVVAPTNAAISKPIEAPVYPSANANSSSWFSPLVASPSNAINAHVPAGISANPLSTPVKPLSYSSLVSSAKGNASPQKPNPQPRIPTASKTNTSPPRANTSQASKNAPKPSNPTASKTSPNNSGTAISRSKTTRNVLPPSLVPVEYCKCPPNSNIRMIVFPESFFCPISGDMMLDPVIDLDGITYERISITTWLAKSHTSPLTRKPLYESDLRPNRALKECIDQFRGQTISKTVPQFCCDCGLTLPGL